MASFYGSIDLLSLTGAEARTLECNGKSKVYVCIPCDFNEITIRPNTYKDGKLTAPVKVNIRPYSEKYKDSVRRSAYERGDSNANVPTHEVTQSYSTDFIKEVIKRKPSMVNDIKEAFKATLPEIVTQDPLDENTALFKQVRFRMNRRIASLYQPQQPQQQQPASSIFAPTTASTAYVPPAEGEDMSPSFDDDMPF